MFARSLFGRHTDQNSHDQIAFSPRRAYPGTDVRYFQGSPQIAGTIE